MDFTRASIQPHLGHTVQLTIRGQVVQRISVGVSIHRLPNGGDDDSASRGACGNASDLLLQAPQTPPGGNARKRLRLSDGGASDDALPAKAAKLDEDSDEVSFDLPEVETPKRSGKRKVIRGKRNSRSARTRNMVVDDGDNDDKDEADEDASADE